MVPRRDHAPGAGPATAVQTGHAIVSISYHATNDGRVQGDGEGASRLTLSQGTQRGRGAGLAHPSGGEARAGASLTWDARDLDAHCAAHLDGVE